MNYLINLLNRINSKIIRELFFGYIKCVQVFSRKRKIRILFSDYPQYEKTVREAFKSSGHDIYFSDFSSENLSKFDLVLPFELPDSIYLNKNSTQIANNLIPIPSTSCINLCNDKYLFNKWLIENGYSKYVPKMGIRDKYPYILKAKKGYNSKNCHIISDEQDRQKYSEKIDSSDYFTQEIISTKTEYAAHIIFVEGEIINWINIKYRYDKNIPINGIDRPKYIRPSYCPYLEVITSILASIEYRGLCCIDYKIQNGNFMLIEINPRCGRSLTPYLHSFVESSI